MRDILIKSKENLDIIPLFILITLLSVSFNHGTVFFSTLSITTGFSIAFIVKFGKDILLNVTVGIVLGYAIGLPYTTSFSGFEIMVLSFAHTLSFIVGGILYRDYLIRNQIFDVITFKSMVLHGVGAIVIIVITTVIGYLISLPVFYDNEFFGFLRLLNANTMGFLMFGVSLMFVFHYDFTFVLSKSRRLVELGFLLFVFFLTGSIYQFGNFYEISIIIGYILVALYFLAGLLFSLRSIVIMALINLGFFHYYFDPSVETFISSNLVLFFSNLYIIFLIQFGMIIRIVVYENLSRTKELQVSKDRLEITLDSTKRILQIGELQHFDDELDIETYTKEIFDIITSIFKKYDAASCYVKDGEYVKYIDAINYDIEELNQFKLSAYKFEWQVETPMHVKVVEKVIKDTFDKGYERFRRSYKDLKEHIAFRVFLSDEEIGGISIDLYKDSDQYYTKEDVGFVQSFQQTVNSYYVFNRLRNTNSAMKDEIVLSLIQTLELYDDYTGGHSEEVAYLSREVGKLLGLSKMEYEEIFWAGIVHDIGKVGVPSSIINKESRLTKDEFDEIKKHPIYGYEIIKKSRELQHVAKLVRHHHEWFNGSGYPDGLKGEEIPLGSRIIQVCDAVSSMIKKRVYSKAKTISEVKEELLLYKESQFCPIVTEKMIELIDSGKLEEYYSTKRED